MASTRAAWDPAEATGLIEARAQEKGAMLPVLHDLQERYGYIHSEAVPLVAQILNVSKAETLGVVSFYHDFRHEPVMGDLLRLCRAESCQAAGSEGLVAHLSEQHGLRVDAGPNDQLTIETVYCLGHCAASPAAMVNGKPVARLDSQKLDAILAGLRRQAS
jgi:formate dehydrogenase subunit gamma